MCIGNDINPSTGSNTAWCSTQRAMANMLQFRLFHLTNYWFAETAPYGVYTACHRYSMLTSALTQLQLLPPLPQEINKSAPVKANHQVQKIFNTQGNSSITLLARQSTMSDTEDIEKTLAKEEAELVKVCDKRCKVLQ